MHRLARGMTHSTVGESRHYDTIVLGAGIAGLATASRLFEHPRYREKNQLLVLEARDRIGGRIDAVHVNGHRLDTGANWIHGIGTEDEPNPLMKILPHKKFKELSGTVCFKPADNGILQSETSDGWVNVASTQASDMDRHRVSNDDLVIPAKIAGPLVEVIWSMLGSLGGTASQTPADKAKQIPMLHAIIKSEEFQNSFRDLPKDYYRTLSAMPQFLEMMEAAPLAAQSAEHSKGQPGFGLLEFAIDDFDGEQVFLRDGYIAIVEEVASELVKADIVRIGVEVKQIRWDQKPILITTTDGDYTANEVVCSLPLGVLQHDQEAAAAQSSGRALFSPPLPANKQESIRCLGFGTLDKVFLIYDDAWWVEAPYAKIIAKGLVREPSDEEDALTASPDSLMGFTDELAGIEIHPDGTTSPGVRLVSVMNLKNLTGVPALSAFVSCANATQVGAMSDERASSILHRALSSWFGHRPPKPKGVHVTRWAQDQFSRGSYSHMITGLSETRHREAFQEPTISDSGSKLRFAGEHTSRNHFATVHGALLSGWREADAILKREDVS